MSKDNNPFTRQRTAPKQEKFIEKKSADQIRVDISRKITSAKLQLIPFVKTLDAGFFIRVALFTGVLYYVLKRTETLKDEKVVC